MLKPIGLRLALSCSAALLYSAMSCCHATAKTLQLANLSAEQVKSRCAGLHGTFFQYGEDNYGCKFAKGVVKCRPQGQCLGFPYSYEGQPRVRPAIPAPAPYWPRDQGGWNWQQQNRW
jgi:hypothetical protein